MFSPRTMASEDIDSTGSVTEGCYLFGNPRTFWAFEASVLFPENFAKATWRFTKVRIFLISLSYITFLNPKNLEFPFSTKNSLTWAAVKCEKLNFIESWRRFTENSRQVPLIFDRSKMGLVWAKSVVNRWKSISEINRYIIDLNW